MITDTQEYTSFLKEIQDAGTTSYTTLPSTEPRFMIDANTREITIPSKFPFLAVKHDHGAETIYFEINRYFDDIDIAEHTCIVQFINKSKSGEISEGYYYVQEMDIESVEGKIIFGWTIENNATKFTGDIVFSVRFYSMNNDGKFIYNFNTKPVHSTIEDSLQVCSVADYMYPSEFEIWVNKIDEVGTNLKETEKRMVDKINETESYLEQTIIDTEQELVDKVKETEENLVKRVETTQSYLENKMDETEQSLELLVDEAESQVFVATEQANIATEQSKSSKTFASNALTSANNASESELKAFEYAQEAEDYTATSKSYAVGGTATRENEDTDNAKYYYELTSSIAETLGVVQNLSIATVDEFKAYLGI